jgi:hypothetical protein
MWGTKARPLQLHPTKTWQEREALDAELAEWHASRPAIRPNALVPHIPSSVAEQPSPARPLPRLNNLTSR